MDTKKKIREILADYVELDRIRAEREAGIRRWKERQFERQQQMRREQFERQTQFTFYVTTN